MVGENPDYDSHAPNSDKFPDPRNLTAGNKNTEAPALKRSGISFHPSQARDQ